MKFYQLSALLLLIGETTAQDVKYNDCSVDDYYDDLPNNERSWTKEQLHDLIKKTHRSSVPFTNKNDPGVDDVWGALIDLDPGSEPNTVHLVFSDGENSGIPFGVRDWEKHHLFPVDRGVGGNGVDYTDIFNLKPASPLEASVRSSKFFGLCDVLVPPDTCAAPAEGGAPDTCACNRVYQPPKDVRGDIARALMYMDLRYDGSDTNTLDLRLTDCPFSPETDMAYLSQMLTWHAEDPPDEAEISRNQRACERWQGNRNPFIDFEDLATAIYGDPLPLPEAGRLIYEACEDIPTSAPTLSPNTCDTINPGDFYVFMLNSQEPQELAMFNFKELPAGFEFYLTDNAWNGTSFADNEGTLKFTVPETGALAEGEIIGYGNEESDLPMIDFWEDVGSGTFSLDETGEQIFVYCMDTYDEPRPLFGLSYKGEFDSPGLESYASDQSALPEKLEKKGSVVLPPGSENWLYNGINEGNLKDLRLAIQDPNNWEGSNESRFVLPSAATRQQSVGLVAAGLTSAVLALTYML